MAYRDQARGEPDYVLIMVVATLIVLGLLILYSASYVLAISEGEKPAYFFLRQAAWTAIGLGALYFMYRMDLRFWRRWAIPIMGFTLLALLAVLIVGDERLGARRTLLNGHIQPSEMAKLALVIYVATWLASKGERLQEVNYGLVPFACLLGLVAGLIALEPDRSTAFLVVVIGLTMFFMAGADWKQLAIGLAGTAASFAALLFLSDYGKRRIEIFSQALQDPLAVDAHQVREAILALIRGGMLGSGLGSDTLGKQPGHVVLPHSDGIFAILGEETGLIGGLIIVALYALLAYRGFRIACQATDTYGMLLATGITVWLIAQALIHIAVVIALIPVTGMTLPFISYGGSSLVSCLAGVGLLLNISRGGDGLRAEEVTLREALDVRRRDRGTRVSAADRRRSAAQRNGRRAARRSASRTDGAAGRHGQGTRPPVRR
ncbi:MAG: putative peptidoglycan glycosyltransferase FtsW [Anaerolineae bacterium]|nr:putative peptidoglycan glycosyltransferase FtsW [Anaerolineae bacterium]